MSYIYYLILWLAIGAVLDLILSDVYGGINRILKRRHCPMKKKKLTNFQQFFILETFADEYKRTTLSNEVYYFSFLLQIILYISLICNAIALVVGIILSNTIVVDMLLFEIVHSSVFGAFYLAMTIISIVTIRKAFKSCSKD